MSDECSCDWCASFQGALLACEEIEQSYREAFRTGTPALTVTKERREDVTYMAIENTGALSVQDALAQRYKSYREAFRTGTPLASVNPASDTDAPRDAWPKDTLHDAARQVVKGAKDLVPQARQAVREAADKASAAPTGRAASDGALGRALGSRHTSYGLITGA